MPWLRWGMFDIIWVAIRIRRMDLWRKHWCKVWIWSFETMIKEWRASLSESSGFGGIKCGGISSSLNEKLYMYRAFPIVRDGFFYRHLRVLLSYILLFRRCREQGYHVASYAHKNRWGPTKFKSVIDWQALDVRCERSCFEVAAYDVSEGGRIQVWINIWFGAVGELGVLILFTVEIKVNWRLDIVFALGVTSSDL